MATRETAEYGVLTETAGADVGIPFGTAGELRAGFKWVHQRGDPVIAPPLDPRLLTPPFDPQLLTTPSFTIKTEETGARVLFRWDTLDNPYFPRNGLRVNAEGFFGNRTTTLPICPLGVCSFDSRGFIACRAVRQCGVPAVEERLREPGRAGRGHHQGPSN